MKERFTDLSVGATIWRFNPNRRVYERDADHRKTSGPIYREQFEPCEVTGETTVSWVIGNGKEAYGGGKVPKNPARRTFAGNEKQHPARHGSFYLTAQAVDDACWANHHRYQISRAVERATVAELREVAKIIGFVAEDNH